jgi:ubiquitin-conjugating enzyme E2 Q
MESCTSLGVGASTPTKTTAEPGFRPASFYIYDKNFDGLEDGEKSEVICALLDIFPTVGEMRDYLSRPAQSTLSSWVDRFSPAALGILRWIIASNRACIMQVDDDDSNGEERLHGMPGWSQFRFAMGAPDKERRFAKAVRDTTKRLGLSYPTLFAWHGSPLANWHSIIREGLHFNYTAHGRAYGHGVYHSLDTTTSVGYTGGVSSTWPGSDLKISLVWFSPTHAGSACTTERYHRTNRLYRHSL